MIDIEKHFRNAIANCSSISEHLNKMRELGSSCKHITELGVNSGQSTWAWVAANPKRLVCVDNNPAVKLPIITQACKEQGISFDLIIEDSLKVHLEQTDILFIDTLHTEHQLKRELFDHNHLVNKLIILHDTESYGSIGEDGKRGGLQLALCSFLLANTKQWRLASHFPNNNGLTVIERL
jgi:hypothetical protein